MTRRMRIEDLTDIAVPEQPALSPDGAQIAYVLRTLDASADRTVRCLWRVAANSGSAQQLTQGPSDAAPTWSPDGTLLAFLRAQDDGPAQLWLLPSEGGEAERLTDLPLGAGVPAWSSDGSRLAFTAPVDLAAGDGETGDERARRAAEPVVIDTLDYQADGAGLLRSVRKHVHLVDVATRSCRQLTTGDWHAGDAAWSPDSTQLAFSANIGTDMDLRLRTGAYLLDADDPKAKPQLVGPSNGVAGPVSWAADGSALFVVGTVGAPVGHAGLLRVALEGGDPVNLAAALDRNVMPGGPGYPGALPRLAGDGSTVLFCARERGCTHLYATSASGGDPRLVLGGAGRTISGMSVVGQVAVVVLATSTSFGEVVTVDTATGAETVRTDHGATLRDVRLFDREEREFAISDGAVVHGWLIRDPSRTGPRPLLLDIHGGPHNAWNASADEIHLYHQELVARGWIVLLVNPRGSDGYGEQFYTAVSGAWGVADANDFLEPIDALVAEGLADPTRLAVTGYSYGGFMTCYLTSRDDRFAAAVAGGVVSDLVSSVGTSDDAHLLSEYELGGQPWQDPARYARLSPLSQVDQVRTPTLILHGAEDRTCPVGQAQQWYTALRELGVPSRMVLYPGGSHLFLLSGPPSHRGDLNRRVVDWVEQYAGNPAGQRRPRVDSAHWERRLAELASRHRVPGAQLGILRIDPDGEDELVEAAFGVLNKNTGHRTTTESLFQIGSISKVWTTTVAMQLVDEGLIDLDAPIVEVLPDLKLADPDVTKQVTLRHLLTHTSGIDGDIFTDTGRGDDCLEKYVAGLEEAAQNHPLGVTWSYCNSGFSLLGRVIEKLTGGTWDQAIRERLFIPLGLSHTVTLPEEALLHDTAVGHVGEGAAEPVPASVWGLPRSLGPAGLVTSTASDVLAFARMHLAGGVSPDGTRVLSAASAAAMAAHHADLPDKYTLGDSWGLGWIRYLWNGSRLIGHDGNTIGQATMLRLLPEQGLAVTVLTNGGNTRDLYEDLYREIFAEVAGVAVPMALAPPDRPVAVAVGAYLGTYERASVRLEVLPAGDSARLRVTVLGPLAHLMPEPVEEYPMVPVEPDLFVVRPPETETWVPVTFYSLPTGERYVHFGGRATPRVAGP